MESDDQIQKAKGKPCYFYIDDEPLTSYREETKKISSKKISDKADGLMRILGSMVNDENYPQDLMMSAIHNLTIVDDINVKKLLFLFWEIIEKQNPNGKIKDEFILVCNSLRKDLESPNEYVRGRVLRLLTKLPHPEILENLKAAVFENLDHPHPYVRSNALMCVMSFINNFGVDVIPDSLPDKLKDKILKDSDNTTKRNAYLVYSRIAPMESLQLTEEILEKTEVSELGDLFALCIAENLRKLCLTFSQKKSMFIKMLLELSAHKSHSVLFEIGSILLEVSSSPNVVANAVNILCALLHDEKDNNTLIIILKKLISIKNKYKDILQEQILSFANILNLNYAVELHKIVIQLINELIAKSNITQVFDNFINTFNQLNKVKETETTINFRNMILQCMLTNIKKFPDINKTYPLFLLEKNLSSSSKSYSHINSIKDLFSLYSVQEDKTIINEMINKIIKSFEDIDSYEIMQTCIWILSNYSNDFTTLKTVFDLIMKNLGDLEFEYVDTATKMVEERKDNDNSTNTKKTITKTVVLPDGTYGTVTTVVDSKELNKHKENKYLRKFILESNYFFSANLVSSITNMIFKMKKNTESEDKYKIYFYNGINIICSILKMNSVLIYKDPDNTNFIQTCLKFLLSNDDSLFEEWNNEYRKIETTPDSELCEKKEEEITKTQPDDYIQFRHCKYFDPDNFDVVDDQANSSHTESTSDNSEDANKNRKFIEVLSGSEDPLFVESVVEIFTFDLSIEFIVKNKTKNNFQNVTIQLFTPSEFNIIEKAPSFNINAGETVTVRSCVKFSKTINAYIFGQLSFTNYKGQSSYLNLSGIFIDLLNTYSGEISDIQFRKNWLQYSWEHNVMVVSRRKSFKEIIGIMCKELKMSLVFPKTIDKIDDSDPFLVANLYTRTKLGEDALINISIEKGKEINILGTCLIRSKEKEFMTALGEKIKALIS